MSSQRVPEPRTHSHRAPTTPGLPPGPRYRTPFGFLAALKRDSLGFFREAARHGDFVCVRFPPFKTFIAYHPDDVQRILRDNHRNYWKGQLIEKFKRVAGEGLVFSDGELWKRQRQLAQPAFARDRIDAMAGMIGEVTARTLDGWEKRALPGEPLEMMPEISRLTLEIVARALFGTDFREKREGFSDAVTRALDYVDHLMGSFVPLPEWVPTKANRHGARATRDIDRFVHEIIAARQRSGAASDSPDLLSYLLAARDAEGGRGMDAKQLRDEMVTFLVAGHETTAVALTWTTYLVARHPAVAERLHEEVDRVLGDRIPGAEDLESLDYVRMVFEEAMRLYPPAPNTVRQAFEDDELGGYRMPAGLSVSVSQYVTHRHPEFWEDPERFDPERFRADRVEARHPFAYFPFGGGPRACVGKRLAMLEGQLILAMIAQRFRLTQREDRIVGMAPIITLRPADPVWMEMSIRH